MEARPPRMVLLLSEIWTMTDPRALRKLLVYAQQAEAAGFDAVMLGEHVVMGPSAGFKGRPTNPRDWFKDGNQDPGQSHPSCLHILGAIAGVTSTLRVIAAAVITPLRHPLILAKETATVDLLSEGRLVVMPSVSWQREEYAALGVPFDLRGKILDEQYDVLREVWSGSPSSHHGRFFNFDQMYVEPQPFLPGGPPVWIGGGSLNERTIGRIVSHGSGYYPTVRPSPERMSALATALEMRGRDMADIELATTLSAEFRGADDRLALDDVVKEVPGLMRQGYSTFVLKPSQFIDDGSHVESFCHDVLSRVRDL